MSDVGLIVEEVEACKEEIKLTVDKNRVLKDIEEINKKSGSERFALGEAFAAGGQATLFDFTDKTKPDESLCVKVISLKTVLGNTDSPKEVYKRYRREIESLKKLKDCFNVVRLYSSFTSPDVSYDKKEDKLTFDADKGGYLYLVIQKLTPLKKYVSSVNGSLKNSDSGKIKLLSLLKKLTIDICHALAVCQTNDILHRDINSDNIVVLENGDVDPDFLLTDFGISRSEVMGKVVTIIGTENYIAREIRNRESIENYSSDIYSLGVTVRNLLTEFNITNACPGFDVFDKVISKAQKDVEERYKTANEMLEDLKDKLSYEYAKKLFCDAKVDDAFAVASDVIKSFKSNTDSPEVIKCKRLVAIIKHNKAYDSSLKRVTDPDLFREATSEMYELAFDEDVKASYFYYLYSMQGMPPLKRPEFEERHKQLLKFLVYSAEEGYAFAQFAYGKFLYEGNKPFEKNEKLGFDYIMKAAEQNCYNAKTYIINKIAGQNPNITISEDTVKVLAEDTKDVKGQLKKAKYLFL